MQQHQQNPFNLVCWFRPQYQINKCSILYIQIKNICWKHMFIIPAFISILAWGFINFKNRGQCCTTSHFNTACSQSQSYNHHPSQPHNYIQRPTVGHKYNKPNPTPMTTCVHWPKVLTYCAFCMILYCSQWTGVFLVIWVYCVTLKG